MSHKILYKWICILLKMFHSCFTLPVENTNMLMVSDQTLFASEKEMQNVQLIAKRKSICVICFPWKDRSCCYLIDEMLYTKLTVINTILRYHFKSCKCNALEYVLWHLHCCLLGIKSSSCLKHWYLGVGRNVNNFKWQCFPGKPMFKKPGTDHFSSPISLLKNKQPLGYTFI